MLKRGCHSFHEASPGAGFPLLITVLLISRQLRFPKDAHEILGSRRPVLAYRVNCRELEFCIWLKGHFQVQRDNDRPRVVQFFWLRQVTLRFIRR